METEIAVSQLAALAHEGRLAVFRHLMKAGPEGMPAGAVAAAVSIAPSTLSHHLNLLRGAGLIERRRQGRTVIYSIDLERAGRLFDFLINDCCDGRPDICFPGTAGACAPPKAAE